MQPLGQRRPALPQELQYGSVSAQPPVQESPHPPPPPPPWRPPAPVPAGPVAAAPPALEETADEIQELVMKVKTFQRQSEHQKQLWWDWARLHGRGVNDPSKHPASFLKQFLEEHGGEASEARPPASLEAPNSKGPPQRPLTPRPPATAPPKALLQKPRNAGSEDLVAAKMEEPPESTADETAKVGEDSLKGEATCKIMKLCDMRVIDLLEWPTFWEDMERDVVKECELSGKVLGASVQQGQSPTVSVHFAHLLEAEECRKLLNGRIFAGSRIEVEVVRR